MADQASEGLLSPFLASRRVRIALPFLRGRILDVGCGAGALAAFVPPERYVGIDVDDRSLTVARQRYPGYEFQAEFPPLGVLFDTVVGLAVIEHVANPLSFLQALAARLVVSADSRIVCTTPHPAVDWIHGCGARLGLFSRHANDEHEELLDGSRLKNLAVRCGLRLVVYRRFLFGANQLAVYSLSQCSA